MQECILAGCDLHDKSMLVKVAQGRGEPEKHSWTNTPGGRGAMVKKLQQLSLKGKKRVVFAYEASGQGFGLHDALAEARTAQRSVIAYLHSEDVSDLRKLMAIGALPGTPVELLQRFPSYLIRIGHSQFAIDQEMARQIYIRPA